MARDDLDDLVRYISRDSAFYARRFGQKVILATRRIKEYPESGRMIPEAEDKTLREIIVQGYRVTHSVVRFPGLNPSLIVNMLPF